MAQPERSPSAASMTVSVRIEGRPPYAMFEVVELTATTARLRSPLLLELGEHVALRVTRGDRSVDVEGRVVEVEKGEGGEPVSTVELLEGGSAVAPLLG